MRDAEWTNRQVGHPDEIGRGHSAPVALVLLRRPATRRYVSDGDTHAAATG